MLPPAACKKCVYWFRVFIGERSSRWAAPWYKPHGNCGRCGIPIWEILDRLADEEEAERRDDGENEAASGA